MPETTSTNCSDLDQNEPTILVPSSYNVDIAGMVGKLTLNNSNSGESDASSDGGSEATETAQPLNSEASYTIEVKHLNQSPSVDSNSSVLSDASWTNSDRDQERQRRSRSLSECSDSSSASSDSFPPEECVVECNGKNTGLQDLLNNLKNIRLNADRQNVAKTNERDVDSNGAKEATDDLDDYESSSDDNQDPEDEAAAKDTDTEYTQRGPMVSAAKGSPPHGIKPYDSRRDKNWNYAVRETSDRYSQKPEDAESETAPDFIQRGPMKGTLSTRVRNGTPYNPPDVPLGSSPTRDEVEASSECLSVFEQMWQSHPEVMEKVLRSLDTEQNNQQSSTDEPTTFNGAQAPPRVVIDVSPNNPPMSPSPTHQLEFYPMRQYSPSSGSTSPASSVYTSETPSPTTYTTGVAAGMEDITGSFNFGLNPVYAGSPLSDSEMHADATWPVNDLTSVSTIAHSSSPPQYFMNSVHPSQRYTNEPCTTTSTIVVNSTGAGRVIVNTQRNISHPEVMTQAMPTVRNTCDPDLDYLVTEGILPMNQFVREAVIPTTVRDIVNRRDDPVEYRNLLRSLDIDPSRSADTIMQIVSLASLRSNLLDLLDRRDEEFSARDARGNTYAMVLLSRRKHVILQRLARLLVTLEKMHRVPAAFKTLNTDHHDLLYMAAINFGGRYQFIITLVLEKTFKAVGPNSEIWTRTYDDLGNTLIHIVIANGPEYVNVLQELLDVRTTGNQTVFSLTAVNAEGETPYDLAVAADSGRNDNYPEITGILANYRTPVASVGNLMGNAAPNVPFVR